MHVKEPMSLLVHPEPRVQTERRVAQVHRMDSGRWLCENPIHTADRLQEYLAGLSYLLLIAEANANGAPAMRQGGVIDDRLGEDLEVGKDNRFTVPGFEHSITRGHAQHGTALACRLYGIPDLKRLPDQ